jgi:hypothetical protein
MNLFDKIKSNFTPAEQAVIERFWAGYQAELAKTRIKPDSLLIRAKEQGVSKQALWEREKRAAQKLAKNINLGL